MSSYRRQELPPHLRLTGIIHIIGCGHITSGTGLGDDAGHDRADVRQSQEARATPLDFDGEAATPLLDLIQMRQVAQRYHAALSAQEAEEL